MADFANVTDYLFSLKAHGPRFGIDRMRAFASDLGHPERRVPCVHVAGTNGKGSVSAMLDAIFREAGLRCGLFTSPHLVHVGERVQVDRQPLTDAEIVGFVQELKPVADRIGAQDPELSPSFFEYMTAMAFLQFARRGCDIAVYEVGLGGRLDATNVVTPEIAVITSIGLDHCEILGSSLAQIAAEKAGIIKPGVPVILGRMPAEAEQTIRGIAARTGAPVCSVVERFGAALEGVPQTNLAGEYQRWNAATAVLASETLRRITSASGNPVGRTTMSFPGDTITDAAIARGLAAVHWPGRWERRSVSGRTLILDASHNAEGAEALRQNLRELAGAGGPLPIVVTGVLGAARAEPLLKVIAEYAREVHVVALDDPRSCSVAELERMLPKHGRVKVVQTTVGAAFPGAGECCVGSPGDLVVVTGSIYLLGEVVRRL